MSNSNVYRRPLSGDSASVTAGQLDQILSLQIANDGLKEEHDFLIAVQQIIRALSHSYAQKIAEFSSSQRPPLQ